MTTNNEYGPGSEADTEFCPVPQECQRLLRLLVSTTIGFTQDEKLLGGVKFVGSDLPCVPGPFKSQAISAVLHAMVGILGHEILALRGIQTDRVTITNTDHAGLFPNTPGLIEIDGAFGPEALHNPKIPNWDHGRTSTPLLKQLFAIFPTTQDGVWYQLHGSSDPWSVLRILGIDPATKCENFEEAYELIKAKTLCLSSRDLDMLMMEHGAVGQTVYSPQEWLQTKMGASLASHPLVNSKRQTQCPDTPPVTFPNINDKRPLAGLKVLELARILAAPTAGSFLASMGAEVIRVQWDQLMDYTAAQACSIMAGKITLNLNLNTASDRLKLHELMEQADLIIQGYRLGSLERRGFGLDEALRIANKHGRGIIYVDENCYGPDGYYAERPGWQQVADAASGCSYVMGSTLGLPAGQGALPPLPVSDMCTGLLTAVTALCAIRDRAQYGGSYHAHAALTAFDCFLLSPKIRLYSRDTVRRTMEKYQISVWGGDAYVSDLYEDIAEAWKKNSDLIDNEDFFVRFKDGPYGKDNRVLAPVVKYSDSATTPRWTSPPAPFCYNSFRLFSTT